MLTPNPLDRCLWLYPWTEWEVIDAKLQTLSDFDTQSRRTKQMMQGYAAECELDKQGRIRIPELLCEFAEIKKQVVLLGQGNKFEVWDEARWLQQRDEWLQQLGKQTGEASELLRSLAL
jgi:MraZ protein